MKARLLCAPALALCLALSVPVGRADDRYGNDQSRKQKRLRKELESAYDRWLKQDVAYIITDEERRAFSRLQNDDERDQFVEQFWLRRDPTPDTLENESKEEHYRRIAYANERFASGLPGWKTDRGRIYIMHGAPDEIESHPSGGSYDRPLEQGGGRSVAYPFETWRYRYLEGVGTGIVVEFVDPTMTGEYHITIDPEEKNALQHVPGGSQPQAAQTGALNGNEFEPLTRLADLQRPPAVKFRDLEALVDSTIRYNVLPMKVRADFLRMTDSTVLTPVTIEFENRDLEFKEQNGVARAVVNLYARVTSMTRRVVSVQEDVLAVESQPGLLAETLGRASVHQRVFYLAPGTYRLNVVAKDMNGGQTNTFEMAMRVPQFEPDKLSSSSIVLADLIERAPSRSVGQGSFILGNTKVRPRVSETFRRGEKLGIYFQIYNLAGGSEARKPNGSVRYQVVKKGSSQPDLDFSEELSSLPSASLEQITVEKLLPLSRLAPGDYSLRLVIADRNRKEVLVPAAAFSVQ